jgi:tRNA 2-selenouridine synthase
MMTEMQTISSQDLIERLQNPSDSAMVLLDVRSESEFAEGRLPFSFNIPILTNEHRRLVGICYKEKGNAEAVKLGYELVSPHKEQIVTRWKQILETTHPENRFVTCWRGGQRSEIAAQWIRESGVSVRKVVGGYKGIRNRLIAGFMDEAVAQRRYQLILLGGMTGAGKTDVLRQLPAQSIIDLEGYAHHRGSAFGGYVNEAQHSQQTFENALGLKLFDAKTTFLVEAESRNIGRCVIPNGFHRVMQTSPMIFLETPRQERAARIVSEYVGEALTQGVAYADIQMAMETSLARAKQKLGGVSYSKTLTLLKMAFAEGYQQENHLPWVSTLLEEYYDKLYLHSLTRSNHVILFRGNQEEVLAWWRSNHPA